MSALRYSASMSLDGFVAGPDQSREHPLGVGGERLHAWMRGLAAWRRDAGLDGGVENASTAVYESGSENVGAIVMGRNMFRLFDGAEVVALGLEQVRAIEAPGVTHLTYRRTG